MKKAVKWTLIILICLFALSCAYINVILIIGSGFIFGDIDYTDEERQVAEQKATLLSIFGLAGLCISILIMFLSKKITNFIVKNCFDPQ